MEMNVYVIQMFLPSTPAPAFISQIPEHRKYINELIAERVVLSYAINIQRSQGWITLVAENMEKVEEIIQKSPIFRYLNFEIHELMVYDAEHLRFPRMILN